MAESNIVPVEQAMSPAALEIASSKFRVARMGGDVKDIITSNMGENAKLDVFKLDKIDMPGSGGTTWSVPTLRGDEPVKDLHVVVVDWQTPRAYYAESFEQTGGGSPPDCDSPDGSFGTGTPGGDCFSCPLNKWGSGKDGQGKACKERRYLFLVRENTVLPYLLSAPPSSLKTVSEYFQRLTANGLKFNHVVTSLKLEKKPNARGIMYSYIVPTMVDELSDAERARFDEYTSAIRPALRRAVVELEQTGNFPDSE